MKRVRCLPSATMIRFSTSCGPARPLPKEKLPSLKGYCLGRRQTIQYEPYYSLDGQAVEHWSLAASMVMKPQELKWWNAFVACCEAGQRPTTRLSSRPCWCQSLSRELRQLGNAMFQAGLASSREATTTRRS